MSGLIVFWERIPGESRSFGPSQKLVPLYGASKLQDFTVGQHMVSGKIGNRFPLLSDFFLLFPFFIINLSDCAPIVNHLTDSRSWGASIYTVKLGYNHLLAEVQGPHSPSFGPVCGLVPLSQKLMPSLGSWCMGSFSLPRIFKSVVLQAPLVVFSVRKQWKSSQHLFFSCPFSLQIWELVFALLSSNYSPSSNWT
jgi:hypothetical protein